MKLALPRRRVASRTIDCDSALAWDILSDYTAWPEWLPLVSQATQLAREANFAHVDVELRPFRGRKVSIECMHAPNSRDLVKSLAGQDPEFILDWTLAAAGAAQTLVTVKCIWVHTPSNVKATLRSLNPERWLDGLASQASSFAGDFTAGPSDPSTVMEIHETEEGLICWFKGKKYEMKAVS
jgi:hypothetical protein